MDECGSLPRSSTAKSRSVFRSTSSVAVSSVVKECICNYSSYNIIQIVQAQETLRKRLRRSPSARQVQSEHADTAFARFQFCHRLEELDVADFVIEAVHLQTKLAADRAPSAFLHLRKFIPRTRLRYQCQHFTKKAHAGS